MSVSPEEIAWAAGLFEGEGCFTAQRSRRTRAKGEEVVYYQPVARVEMTDRDVVRRFYDVVGIGTFGAVSVRQGALGQKPLHEWRVTTAREFAIVFQMFAPWLGKRRLQRGIDILETYIAAQHELGKEATRAEAPEVYGALAEGRNHIL